MRSILPLAVLTSLIPPIAWAAAPSKPTTSVPAATPGGATIDIVDLGARPGVLATTATQGAIDRTAAKGGTVYVPPGRWLTGGLELKSGVTLHMDPAAVLVGSPDLKDYRYHQSKIHEADNYNLIHADGAEDITITGGGTIDGNGRSFWDEPGPESRWFRPPKRPMALLACAATGAAGPELRVGPFIQSVVQDRATVLWFGDREKPGTVQYGLSSEKLDRTSSSVVRVMPEEAKGKAKFAHEAVLTGLPPGQEVYYRLTDPRDPLGVACFRSDPGPSATIHFVCAGDEVYFDPFLPYLNAHGIRLDFIMDLGDFQSRVGRYGRPWWRGIPVYICWGNHNVPGVENHWWALPGNKLSYSFEYGPAFFAFSGGGGEAKTSAAWKIAAGHGEMVSNGKGAWAIDGASRLAAAGFALRCNGNDHRYDRSYPIRGEGRDPTGTVFLTYAGNHEATRFVRPAISNYYRCPGDEASLLPLVTVSPGRLELRVLLHRDGEFLPRKDWPNGWAGLAPPRDYPHEWDYYVRVKDTQYATGMVESLRTMAAAGKTTEKTLALVRELGGLVERGAVEPLIQLLPSVTDAKLRREIALALDRIGEERAMAAMKTLAGDKDPMTRIAVARFFAKFGNAADAADLVAFVKDDEEVGGRRGPGTVCPQRYYVEGLMLRIGGAQARNLAAQLFEVAPGYTRMVLGMLARDDSEQKLPILRGLAERIVAGNPGLEPHAASLAKTFGPLAQSPQDVALLVRLAGKLPGSDGWEGIAAGLVKNRASEHVGLLARAYRQLATPLARPATPMAIRKAIQDLTELNLPDPVVTTGKQTTLEQTKVDQGATLAEEWASKRR